MQELVILLLCMLAARINSSYEQETKMTITWVEGNATVCSYCGVHLGGHKSLNVPLQAAVRSFPGTSTCLSINVFPKSSGCCGCDPSLC